MTTMSRLRLNWWRCGPFSRLPKPNQQLPCRKITYRSLGIVGKVVLRQGRTLLFAAKAGLKRSIQCIAKGGKRKAISPQDTRSKVQTVRACKYATSSGMFSAPDPHHLSTYLRLTRESLISHSRSPNIPVDHLSRHTIPLQKAMRPIICLDKIA